MKAHIALPLLALSACAHAAPPATIHVQPWVKDTNVRKVEQSEIITNPDGTITVNAVVGYEDGTKGKCVFVLVSKPEHAKREPALKSSSCEPLTEKAETDD